MPNYSMRNNDTGEEFDITLTMTEREEYLEKNPNITQIFKRFPGVMDPVRAGRIKPDRAFDDALSKVKSAHKYSTVELNR